ncbi:hypothetical protein LNQ49_14680 [Flavobacterium sp. F-65]|uniref:Lipocalin-like domain-containing protein n=1 Tax=Flavobacterium pisciphilum TaxID=2893755 RepID=A0ABS8MVP5_9FLAO|nr:hypothetical protein [Flavobacterium sp. F-65]MCC9072830.1 hypothetical protein [Flavobacterium sp. F-65]
MKKIVFILLLKMSIVSAQKKDIIYRMSYDSYPTVGYSYEVGVLRLHEDYSYSLLWQKYNSRKMARKSILNSSNKEIGMWKTSGDTLELHDNNDKKSRKFIVIGDKKMVFLIEGTERSDKYWRKIKY